MGETAVAGWWARWPRRWARREPAAGLWARCTPARDLVSGRPTWFWCPVCTPLTPAELEALQVAARLRGEFLGSRYHVDCAQALLRAWRRRPAGRAGWRRRLGRLLWLPPWPLPWPAARFGGARGQWRPAPAGAVP